MQPASGAWCLIFGRTFCLLPYFMRGMYDSVSDVCEQRRLWRDCADEPSLVAYVIRTIISWAGSFEDHFHYNNPQNTSKNANLKVGPWLLQQSLCCLAMETYRIHFNKRPIARIYSNKRPEALSFTSPKYDVLETNIWQIYIRRFGVLKLLLRPFGLL